jgi:hypothetical protein
VQAFDDLPEPQRRRIQASEVCLKLIDVAHETARDARPRDPNEGELIRPAGVSCSYPIEQRHVEEARQIGEGTAEGLPDGDAFGLNQEHA